VEGEAGGGVGGDGADEQQREKMRCDRGFEVYRRSRPRKLSIDPISAWERPPATILDAVDQHGTG